MNMAEGARLRALEAQVEALNHRLKDMERRLDDFSKAERTRETLKLKKDAA